MWINYAIDRIKAIEGYRNLINGDISISKIIAANVNDKHFLFIENVFIHKLNIFASKNLNLGEDQHNLKYYVLVYQSGVTNGKTLADDIKAKYPQIAPSRIIETGKHKGTNALVGIQMRKYAANTSNIKYSYTSKFGPYDVLYKGVGSFSKKYLPPLSEEETPTQLEARVIQNLVMQEPDGRIPEGSLMHELEFGGQCFTSSEEVLKVLNASMITQPPKGIHLDEAKLYLRLKHSLAKWFYGKKAALQKLNQDRIQKYLNKDKKDLSNVYNFFGTEMPKKKYY